LLIKIEMGFLLNFFSAVIPSQEGYEN